MKKDYEMVLDDRDVNLTLSRKKVYLNDERLDITTVSIGKKREKTTFQVILYLLAVIAAGVILYASLSALISGDDETRPYVDLEFDSIVHFREEGMDTGQYISVTDGSGDIHNLGGSSVTFVKDGEDTITVSEDINGRSFLKICFFGSAGDIRDRDITLLRITLDTPVNHSLKSVEFITTGSGDEILNSVSVNVPSKYRNEYRTGRNVYNIEVDHIVLLDARQVQESSFDRGTLITLELPDGLPEGDHIISAEWGPDHYHETTTLGLLIGGMSLALTLIALIFVYKKVSRDDPCLILDTEHNEYVLYGDHDDISELYLSISRITIPKMKGADERKKERPGITRGEDLLDEDEARQIGKELKRRPGGSGKMIVHQCPECMGTELYYETGFMTGYKYHCKNCDYVGSFVIEKQVNFDQ